MLVCMYGNIGSSEVHIVSTWRLVAMTTMDIPASTLGICLQSCIPIFGAFIIASQIHTDMQSSARLTTASVENFRAKKGSL